MKQDLKIIERLSISGVTGLMVIGVLISCRGSTQASSLSAASLKLSRMATSGSGPARVVFKATNSTSATNLVINMNGSDTTTWTGSGGSVAASPSPSSASCTAETGATALPGTFTSSTGSAGTITVTGVTALTGGVSYCVDLTAAAAIANPTSVGEFHPTISDGTDSTAIAVRVVSNDQVTVTAIVSPTFTFTLSNIDTFTSSLVAGAVTSTNGVGVGVTTNAKNGWTVWARDANTGLTSAAAAKTIASTTPGTAATLSGSAEGYVAGVTSVTQGTNSSGTTAPITAYDATASGGSNYNGSGLDTTFRQIVASGGTAGAGAGFTLKERAAILSTTPAATDYTDTITLVGAGKF